MASWLIDNSIIKMFFIFTDNFCLKLYFAFYQNSLSSSLLVSVCMAYFFFLFNFIVLLKCSSCRQQMIWICLFSILIISAFHLEFWLYIYLIRYIPIRQKPLGFSPLASGPWGGARAEELLPSPPGVGQSKITSSESHIHTTPAAWVQAVLVTGFRPVENGEGDGWMSPWSYSTEGEKLPCFERGPPHTRTPATASKKVGSTATRSWIVLVAQWAWKGSRKYHIPLTPQPCETLRKGPSQIAPWTLTHGNHGITNTHWPKPLSLWSFVVWQ